MQPATINEENHIRQYRFDDSTFVCLEPGSFGYKEYSFQSAGTSLFADNVKFDPCEIYTTAERSRYVMSLYFDKEFPLIHKDHPTRITWTAFNCAQTRFNTITETFCLKDGKEICRIRRSHSPFEKEQLSYGGIIETNELEFFVCLLYTLHYPEQTASSREVVWP